MHGAQQICFGRLAHWVLLVVRQDHHVLPLIPKVAVQVRRHVLDIVDASPQLPPLAEVVDANKQCFTLSGTIRVLEGVTTWSTMAKGLCG